MNPNRDTSKPLAVRFEALVDRSGGPDACHPWRGQIHKDGYGIIKYRNTQRLAHRAAFFLAHGRWPDPCCCHHCDNRPCCNATHLFEGTHADNNRDMFEKNRGTQAKATKAAQEKRRLIRASKKGGAL